MAKKSFRYWVTGPGPFPDDMLRYDSAQIVRTHVIGDRMFYLIEGKVAPTVGRWSSFLWVVVENHEQRQRWGLPDE